MDLMQMYNSEVSLLWLTSTTEKHAESWVAAKLCLLLY